MSARDKGSRLTVEVTHEAVARPWIRPRSTAALISHWLLIAVGCAVVVLGVKEPQIFGGLVGVLLGGAIVALVGFSLASQQRKPGRVRIQTFADGVAFVPHAAAPVLTLLAATAMVLTAVVGLVGAAAGVQTGLPGTPGGGPVGRYGGVGAVALAGAWGIVDSVSRLLPPRGLKVTPQGVSWRTTYRRTTLRWDDIAQIDLVAHRTQLCVVICSSDRQCTTIYPMTTGSDAYVIAQVLEYYRSQPAARRAQITLAAIGTVRPA